MPDAPIVLLYGPTWDAPSQVSKHHLARHWARTRPVLYVEAPPNPLSWLTRPRETGRLARRWLAGPSEVSPGLRIGTFFYPFPYRGPDLLTGARWTNAVNQAIVSPQLRRVLRRLEFSRPIVVVGGAHALPLLDGLDPRLVVYHCSDDFTCLPHFPASFAGLERDLMRRCDLVIATSEALRQAKQALHPRIHTVPNGAEVAHFARAQEPATPVPPELSRLPRPVIGYAGSILPRVDQAMIAFAAAARPAWSFVMIGPVDTAVGRLRSLPNIHFLGPRPYEEMPRYLKGMDAAMLPLVLDDQVRRASAVKFYEYLASGLPIVATRLPDLEPFEHLAALVSTPEGFLAGLESALRQETAQSRAARMEEARRHSWDARFARIDALIEDALRART